MEALIAQLMAVKDSTMLPGFDVNRLKSMCDAAFNMSMVGKTAELECRLGHFTKSAFDTGVPRTVFDRMLILHRRGGLEESYTEIDRKITSGGFRIDQFSHMSHPILSSKTKVDHIDCQKYQLRIALAEEQPHHEIPASELVVQRRHICRFSYALTEGLRLDMSVVTSNGKVTFEVELELVQPFRPPNEMFEKFMFAIEQLVCYYQDSLNPASTDETNSVKDYIASLMSVNRFAHAYGAQPRTFQKADLALLHQPYAACVKTDGVRCYLFVNSEGHVWLFHRQKDHPPDGMKLFIIGRAKDGSMSEFSGSLLEGELDEKGFHTFDILVFRNRDIRGDEEELLSRRLSRAQSVVDAILAHTSAKDVWMKDMHIFEPQALAKVVRTFVQENTELEGFIMTPADQAYPLPKDDEGNVVRVWNSLLKFKPPGAITVDLRVCLKNRHGLFVILHGREVPFRPRNFPEAGDIESLKLLPTVAIEDGDIVECFYEIVDHGDIVRLVFLPHRVRQDKNVPNAMHVALDNLFASVVDPCSLEDLMSPLPAPSSEKTTGRRTDEFWLCAVDFDAHQQNPYRGNAFPNDIKALCLPASGVAGAMATLLPPPPPERVIPPPLPLSPTPALTETVLLSMKVDQLKLECRSRGLAVKGVREDLRTRLRPFVSATCL